MSKYCVGVDFGSLSARALVADVADGRELAAATMDYPHAVMTEALPDGTRLPPDWALQHPQDYLDCLRFTVTEAVRRAGVSPEDVIGFGLDFTADTMLSIDESGAPLCLKPEFASNPHAWCMLWKHHAAQRYANRMTEIAEARGEAFLPRYGGRISSEWMPPRLWQILSEAPEVYAAAHRFIEAGDWLVMQLTGAEARSAAMAGYKMLWHHEEGYPSEDFFAACDPGLRKVAEKLGRSPLPVGSRAGRMTEAGARLTGLRPGIAVAVANIDAHVSLPAAGLTQPGGLMMILGTSACHIMLGDCERAVPGLCGVTRDGAVAGLYGYEAGQSCCGDHFKWFADNCVPRAYADEADRRNLGVQQLLTEKAARLRPGQSGLIALDWWNGNRSVLADFDLTGLMVGMTLATRPEEIYRALIEATAYGARVILENFERNGVPVGRLFACGGVSKKNALMMQIYADVLRREIRVARSDQAPALGSAMFGAVAAGADEGGYASIADAARKMGGADARVYVPDEVSAAVYDELYGEYVALHDCFGRGGSDVMKRLKRLRDRQSR